MARYNADFWIRHLQLIRHIEGGWFNEVYRSGLLFTREQLSPAFADHRNACTHIYFLLEKKRVLRFSPHYIR
ncbi:MAG: cupin domain-containing protein [Bacteroidota bacterium]